MSDVKDMPDDLNFLATRLHEWPEKYTFVRRDYNLVTGYSFTKRTDVKTSDGWFSQDQWKVAREQMGMKTPAWTESAPSWGEKYSKYYKDVRHLDSVDVYRVLSLFDCDRHGHAIGHAAKKLLLSGERTGRKSVEDDVREAIDTLKRWLEMREEDGREV